MSISNVSELVSSQALAHPSKRSIVYPHTSFGRQRESYYTFAELETQINRIANKLTDLGVKEGDKVLFFVKPNLDFCAITFALFRLGATSVFIDPGMNKKAFFKCIKQVDPDVLIGIPAVHFLRQFVRGPFSNIRIFITTGKLGLCKTKSLYRKLDSFSPVFKTIIPKPSDLAAILFTSGGTGIPKGVEYTHSIFISQTRMLQEEFGLTYEDVDIPGFPLFSFFTLAMGMTSVIPQMNPSKPGKCDPKKLYKNIMDSKATFVAGSPAIWERLAMYCKEDNLTLPTVKYLTMFGAPVRAEVHEIFAKALTHGTTYTPYGATECLPVSNMSGRNILDSTHKLSIKGSGTCIGNPFPGVKVKIIKEDLNIIEKFENIEELGTGEIGEIIISSPNVTRGYYQMDQKTKEAKIYEGDIIWHRMGDVGYLDSEGRLWFCGRQKHVFVANSKKYYPIPAEEILNNHPSVTRSALIHNTKSDRPEMVIKTSVDTSNLHADLIKFSSDFDLLKDINLFHFVKDLPVDTRHNIKIDRTLLSKQYSELT